MVVLDGLSEHDYHADDIPGGIGIGPFLSKSVIHKLLTRSPKHAWASHPKLNPDFVPEVDHKYDLGTAAHALLVEGRSDVVVVIDAKNWQTNAAKAERDEATAAGKVAVLAGKWDQVQRMVDAAWNQLHEFDPVPFLGGKSEQTIVYQERNGVWVKVRIDYLHNSLHLIDDYKTTQASAAPEAWGGTMYGFMGDIQAALYTRALETVALPSGTRVMRPEFRFITQELEDPYALSVFELAPDALTIADAKIDHALDVWKACLQTGKWPSYPKRVCYIQAPPWAEAQWFDREARDGALLEGVPFE